MDTTRKPEHTWAVSRWVIPGDWDYANAWVSKTYFRNEIEARLFAKRHADIPEMAVAYKLKQKD